MSPKSFNISIHAPSRERQLNVQTEMRITRFQSTLPHGSDIAALKVNEFVLNFNPRSLTGATFKIPDYYLKLFISIHAPSRERQAKREALTEAKPISIHAPSRERLSICENLNDAGIISIHAPSRERRWTLTSCWRSRQFQSTLPHGSDMVTSWK